MSLFGAPPANNFSFGTPAPAAAPPSLFGQPAAQSTPAPSFSLFGAPKPTPPPLFGAPAPTTNSPSLFGAPPAPPAAPKFSFGAPAVATPPVASPWGAPAPAPATGGLFGAPQQPGGLGFGAQAPKPLFGQSAPAANPVAPAAPASTVTKVTKFNDAPDQYRSLIESIDTFIKSQNQLSEELKSRDLGSEITKVSDNYTVASSSFATISNQLSQDARTTAELRQRLETDQADLGKVTTIIEGFKNPQAKGAAAKVVANFPFEYFSRRAEEFNERIERYKTTMDQIQQACTTSDIERNPSAILPTLRAQHTSFMALASSVATLDTELKSLKEDYRLIWKEKTGSVQDPFGAGNRRKGGAGGGIEGMVEGMNIR